MAHSLQTDFFGIADRGPSSAKAKPVSGGQGDVFRKLLPTPEGEESRAADMQPEMAIAKEPAPGDTPNDLLVPAAAMPQPDTKPQTVNGRTGDISPSAATTDKPGQAAGGELQTHPADRPTGETAPAPSDDTTLADTVDEATVIRADRVSDTAPAGKADAERIASAGASQATVTGAAAIANSRTAKSETAALTGIRTAPAATRQASEPAAQTPGRSQAKGSQQAFVRQSASGDFEMPPRLDEGAASPPPAGGPEATGQSETRSLGGESSLAGLPTTPGNAAATPQPASPVVAAPAAPAAGQVIAAPEDVVDIIRTRTASGEPSDRVTVQLDPPELGRVSIDFKFDAQGLQHVTITGDSPEALRQLRQLHFQLTQALEQQGLTANDMSFRQNSSQHGQSQMPGYLSMAGRDEEDAALAAQLVSTSAPRRLPDGSGAGLNIKL